MRISDWSSDVCSSDLEQGWRIVYAADVITRHFPSIIRDAGLRERLLIRNAIWVAWMRRPFRAAYRETMVALHPAYDPNILGTILLPAVMGMPRAVRRRKVISPDIRRAACRERGGQD